MTEEKCSRDIGTLEPKFGQYAVDFIDSCKQHNFPIKLYCFFRPLQEQARLFRQSRTLEEIKTRAVTLRGIWNRPDLADILMNVGPVNGKLGHHVTFAAPGQSLHNYGLAFDGAPLQPNGTIDWDDEMKWQEYRDFALEVGLVILSHEFPHCQMPGANWKDLIRKTSPTQVPVLKQKEAFDRGYREGWNTATQKIIKLIEEEPLR